MLEGEKNFIIPEFDWSRIRLPLIPEVARSCSDHLFSLPASELSNLIKFLEETHPDLLKALMESPQFQSNLSHLIIPLLKHMPEGYPELLLAAAKQSNLAPSKKSVRDFFNKE